MSLCNGRVRCGERCCNAELAFAHQSAEFKRVGKLPYVIVFLCAGICLVNCGDILRRLRAENEQQLDIRRISYFVGAVFFLCLERFGKPMRNEIDSELTAYEQNPLALACGVTVQPCLSLKTTYEKLVEDRKRTITEHIAHTSYTECDGIICGYDPMNMFRVGNQIYCSHIVFLKVGDAVQTHQRAIVLVCKDSSEREIKGYY